MYIYIIIAVIAVILVYLLSTFNKLVVLRNKVKDQWSQIAVQLKRRADLIPNLVETVKGYAKHESETFEEVIKARNAYNTASTPEEEMKASGAVTNALSKLFALSEAYPDLKANKNFMALQGDLKETEDKISYSRQFYNDEVLTFNNKVEMFPSNIVASLFAFKKATFFEIDESDKKNPEVKF